MDASDPAAMQDAQGPQDGDGPELPQPISAGGDERQVADARLWVLVSEMERLTTSVSPEAFADAVARLQQRATASESLGGESPELPPRRLFGDTAADASSEASEASGAAGVADAASEAGSEPARSYASTVD